MRNTKREPNLAAAAEKTGLFIRGLQSRLLEGGSEVEEQPVDTAATLEKQLQEYFASWPGENCPETGSLNRIRNRVIEGVAARMLRGWRQDAKALPLEDEVTERLIDLLLQTLAGNDNGAGRKARVFSAPPNPATTKMSGNQMPT
jgi:hypothetical protein